MIYLLDIHALWHHASDGGELSSLAAARLDEARLEDLWRFGRFALRVGPAHGGGKD